MDQQVNISYFISSHGYGHAARAASVMCAASQTMPNLHFHIFTEVPRWFFVHSQIPSFSYYECETDVGFYQTTALEHCMDETLRRLSSFAPFPEGRLDSLAKQVSVLDSRLLICDISPLGIAVGKTANIPSVLIENFTWDWMYTPAASQIPKLNFFVDFLAEQFSRADYHVQTVPYCQESEKANLRVPPVSRKPRLGRAATRKLLELDETRPMVMLTMGGIPWDYSQLDSLEHLSHIFFVIPGSVDELTRRANILMLPHHNRFFHPDLVRASDVVIGKLGYSTLAEVYQAGIAFGYIPRKDFPESPPLAAFAQEQMPSKEIPETGFLDGSWTNKLPQLLNLPRVNRSNPPGAELIAQFLTPLITD